MRASRTGLPKVLALAVLAAFVATPTAPAATPDDCPTPVAPDGHEPPCNPALAQTPWAASHRASYAQASSPFAGPVPGQEMTPLHTALSFPNGSGGVPITLDFSEPYPDGKRVVWGSVVSAPENQGTFKLDPETGEVIDFLARPTGQPSSGSSGAYNALDRDNHLIVARGQSLDVYGDGVPGERLSPVALLKSFDLTRVLCRPDDRVVGITMLFDGMVAFATELGVTGVVPRQPEHMTTDNLHAISLNGADCANADKPRDELEQVSNSIAGDEEGGVYVVTSVAQYKFRWDGRSFEQAWRAEYETGGVLGGARLGIGSGSTPTLMGTHPGDDKFVVITDGQQLMHLVLFWRDEIPADWQPIAPGKDRRIACEVPVRFGDPNRAESVSEQSVLVRGYASVVVNNAHGLDDVFALLPGQVRPFSVLLDQVEGNAPRGLERIDWDPGTRTCSTRWVNKDVSMPNAIPTMSIASGLVYAIGQRSGTWGVEGVDFETGEGKLWVPSSPDVTENSFFAATEVGPDQSIWTGTFQGVSAYRPAAGQAPAAEVRFECRDRTEPSSRIDRRRSRITRGSVVLRGSASDTACGEDASVRRVDVAVARLAGRRCAFLTRRGRLARPSSCSRPRFLRTQTPSGQSSRWVFRQGRLELPAGRYAAWSRARDGAGNVEPRRSRRGQTTFRVARRG